MNRINVLYLIEEGQLGGPQVQMARVASAIRKKADVEVIIPTLNSRKFQELCNKLDVQYRLLSIRCMTKRILPAMLFILSFPIEVVRLVRFAKKCRPDLLHAWGGAWQIKGAVVRKLTRVPLVWLINDTQMPGLVLKVFSFFSRWCDGFIFASFRSERYYQSLLPPNTKTSVIQSMVDMGHFDPENHYHGDAHDDELMASWDGATVVGTVANVNPIKGLESLIHVAAKSQTENENIKFVIVGPVPNRQSQYYKKLELLIETLGLDNVTFTGGRSDVRFFLQAFDVYLCTSLAESSPVSVWEAMAMANPIVSTDVGDVPYFVKDGEAGFISSVEDAEGLWKSIKWLHQNESERYLRGRAARRIAEREFDSVEIARQTLEFYADVLEGSGPTN